MIHNVAIQSEYTFLQSTARIKDLVKHALNNNYKELFLADNNLCGYFEFINECKNNNIRPIVGLKCNINFGLSDTFIIIPKTNEAFKLFLELNYLNDLNKELTYDDFKNQYDDFIFITASFNTKIHDILLESEEKALETLIDYKKRFKYLFFGLTLQDNNVNPSINFLNELKENKIHCVIAHNVYYINIDEKETYSLYNRINNLQTSNFDQSFLSISSYNEYKNYFSYVDYGYDLLLRLLKNCQYLDNKYDLPIYIENSASYLKNLAIVGLNKRLKDNISKLYMDRLLNELSVIDKMGFNNYFLIVFDFVSWAKKNNITVGPGRGSSVGSLVAYSVGITEIDPIKYDLLFERFLNPMRTSMPDIDIDIDDQSRDEVIKYVINKYGEKHVMQIATFSRFGFRSALRDIQRVNKINESFVKRTIQRYETSDIDDNDEEMFSLVKLTKNFLDLPRHIGTHASGVVMSKEALTKTIPYMKSNIAYQTQIEANILESLGLLKIDFLSLSNLTFLKQILAYIPSIKSIYSIPLDDEKTYKLLSKADTDDIFQLESAGMKKVLKKLKPNKFSDLVALLALFRPGPLDSIDDFINARDTNTNSNKIAILDPILNETYGIPIYQEQIMNIVCVYAGFDLFEADIIRRTISKKNIDEMSSIKDKFLTKSISLGREKNEAIEVFNKLEKFAEYGFNKSHSVAYAMLSYQLAYLKANHYLEFNLALLNRMIGINNESLKIINELLLKGYKFIKPSLKLSKDLFYLNKNNQIVIPFNYITGITSTLAKSLISIVNNTKIESLNDFLNATKDKFSKEIYHNLIYSGVFDSFSSNKKQMIDYVEAYILNMLDYVEIHDDVADYSFDDLASYERFCLGFNLNYNLAIKYQYESLNYKLLEKRNLKTIAKVIDVKEITTKNNELMGFITFSDNLVKYETICFPKTYEKYKKLSNSNNLYIILLRMDKNNNSIILDDIVNKE